ncbi:ATP-binding protein [Bacillus aquiflavi]|uniref:ATP-binding protein n=1 Tax=Bacillus aquiflavi TaxID=2672567 RepID=A0A6B3VZP9_9BACI|nr:ATP-binding protein [Bacillus aquiflavi]MBA4536846.1 ATP-binding protein [Bacillus aquiflavi]NEY81213.1 ATP-binding protein [Bacillus aquiflavi]UAC48477.1 ATP-binding protein [Bacillus aquiflavi]
MKRDVVTIELNREEVLVIASDNSGSIGLKKNDSVHVPYDIVAYYSFRVAVMECIAAGAVPFSVVMHNFCGDEALNALISGVKQGMKELSLNQLEITGSTESNFQMEQSALGMIVLGKRNHLTENDLYLTDNLRVAVIGSPLVGEEVITSKHEIAPLSLFKWAFEQDGIKAILPVGSKGILFELNQLFTNCTFELHHVKGKVDLLKSSGPSTCFIIVYVEKITSSLKENIGNWFHPLTIQCEKE